MTRRVTSHSGARSTEKANGKSKRKMKTPLATSSDGLQPNSDGLHLVGSSYWQNAKPNTIQVWEDENTTDG